MLLTEIQQPKLPSKLYHITEASNLPAIKEDGLNPHTGKRGVNYKDSRIHFFTDLHEDVVEEIKSLVLFGGLDTENDELMNSRANTPLVLLEIDTDELREFDRQMAAENNQWRRVWGNDHGVTAGYGVWTNLPVPFADIITVHKL